SDSRLQLWVGEGRVDLFVELIDDLDGRISGSADALRTTRLVARYKLIDSGDVRQHFRAGRRSHRQRAHLTRSNVFECRTNRFNNKWHLPGEKIGKRPAAIWYVEHIDASHHLE